METYWGCTGTCLTYCPYGAEENCDFLTTVAKRGHEIALFHNVCIHRKFRLVSFGNSWILINFTGEVSHAVLKI